MTRRGFSLIELLMAIFILGIGLISIAALFPAGIALQQRAEDELNGPIVAAHALEVIRGRLSSDDFGSWWDFHNTQVDYTRWNEGDDVADVMEDNTVGKLYNDRYS
ncbi:MAG: prepilin-type N-terminal cleavage/methylation domain-containing protein, partial [Phycisphaerales bacterium]|nr:prepilin-type N-terminal cleavage/methylation domain-containing protein [Phycisphaerales bacterium]